jgi:NitT/TauT family transport system permease protein
MKRPRMKRPTKLRLIGFFLFVAAAEAACRTGLISRLTMIPPSDMAVALAKILASGEMNDEIMTTMGGVLLAAVGSILVGFVLGALLHALPRVRESLDPLLASYYSVPIYVFYPMLLVFCGMNRTPIVVIGFLFAVVAMMTSTLNGLDRVPRVLVKTSRVLRMSWVAATLRITLPSAAPYVLGGVKLAIAYSFVGVLGAEFILSDSGLGYRISLAFNTFDNFTMYPLIVLVVIIVVGVNTALFGWERALLRRRGGR